MATTPAAGPPCPAFIVLDGDPMTCERPLGHGAHHGMVGHDDNHTPFAVQWADMPKED